MSTDLMKTIGNTLPADIREQLSSAVAEDLARLGSLGGKDSIRITQDKKFQFPDETISEGPLSLIIVDFVYRNEYYPQAYSRKDPVPPVCFAVNPHQAALAPTKNCPKPQVPEGKHCTDCQWDKYGTSPQGEGKACKNTAFMAVLQPDATADSPLFVLKTSPTGIRYLNQHIAKVGRQFNLPVWAVTTKLHFDPNISYPSLRFDIEGGNPVIEETQRRLEEARFRLLQEPDFGALMNE